MLLTRVRQHWSGTRWRWWALLAGLALTAVCLLGGAICAALFNASRSALLLLWDMVALVVTGAIGAGLLDRFTGGAPTGPAAGRPTLASRMAPAANEPLLPRVKTADDERRDRTTIRAAIMALPLLVTFLVLLLR